MRIRRAPRASPAASPLPLAAVLVAALACEPPLRVENVPDGPLPAGTLWPLGSGSRGVAWTVDDSAVATVTPDGIVWARAPGQTRVRVWRGADQANAVLDVEAASDGKIVFVGEERVRVVRLDGRGETALPLTVRAGRVEVSPDGTAIAFTGLTGGVYWARLDGTGLRQFSTEHPHSLAFAGDDRLVYTLGSQVRLLTLADGSASTVWSEEPPRADGGRLAYITTLAWGGADTLYFAGGTTGFPHDERLGALQAVDSLYVAEIHDIAGTRRAIAHALARDPESVVLPGPPAPVALIARISVSEDRRWLLVGHAKGAWQGPVRIDAADPQAVPRPFGPAPWTVFDAVLDPAGDRAVAYLVGANIHIQEGLVLFAEHDAEFAWAVRRAGLFNSPIWSR